MIFLNGKDVGKLFDAFQHQNGNYYKTIITFA
jgi:hypothetical protein